MEDGHAGTVVHEEALGGRQARLLLARLAWERDSPVRREALAETLWPEGPPSSWTTALATVVSAIRSALAALSSIELTAPSGCYRLGTSRATWVDVEAARRAVHEAEGARRAGRMQAVYAHANVATAIVRRPLLAGHDEPWVLERRRDLTALRVRALDCVVDFSIWNGEFAAAVQHAETLVALDEFREVSHRALMRAHAAAGDRASAILAFERLRELLRDELGISPSPESLELHRSLLG